MSLLRKVFGRLYRRKHETLAGRKCDDYVDPSILKMLMSDSMPSVPPIFGEVNFLLMQFIEDDTSALQSGLNDSILLLRDEHAHIESVCGSLLFTTFGAPPFKVDSPARRRETVATKLIERLGTRVRIVHGICDGVTGEHGTRFYGWFGTALRRFNSALEQLLSLSPGELREFK